MVYLMYLVIYLIAELCVENYSELVYPDENGRLVYKADSKGNVIPDFSHAGYMGGGVALPYVPVVKTVWPQMEGDDTERLQAAIDDVSARSVDSNGFRGALLLKRGEYRVEGTLRIQTSGVVLRGEGDDANGTVLIATGVKDAADKHTLIEIGVPGVRQLEIAGTRQDIVDDYVPVGAYSFNVVEASGFAVGDSVIVHRPSTQAWIEALGMHLIPNNENWKVGRYDCKFDRIVTAVSGNRITLDAPLGNAFQEEYGGGVIYKYEYPERIEQVGIENIRGVSEFDDSEKQKGEFSDEDHSWNFLALKSVKNAWARNLTSARFVYSCVEIGYGAKWVTVQDCRSLDPVSSISGGRRYSFRLNGELSLVQRCYTRRGRHDFMMQSRVRGPNAFVDCMSEKANTDSGPHSRWSVACLYDNVSVKGTAAKPFGSINVQNRWSSGGGHGWAGAQMVLWNCVADSMAVQKPPTAQNYAIGCIGAKWPGRQNHPPEYGADGHWESLGQHVYPRSLYFKQLEDRLGMDAVRAVAADFQIRDLLAGKLTRSRRGNGADFNQDGCVGFSDFLAFTSHYGLREGQPGYDVRYDLDGDKAIGFGDFLIFAAQFGQSES